MRTKKLSRRAAVIGLVGAAAVAGPATAIAAAVPDDPFLTELDRFNKVSSGWTQELAETNPDAFETLGDKVRAAMKVTIETDPTTVAGIAAKLEFMGDSRWGDGQICAWGLCDPKSPWTHMMEKAFRSMARRLRSL